MVPTIGHWYSRRSQLLVCSGLPELYTNAIGSYTHDLYEAEAAQVEDRMQDVQQLMYQLGDEAADPMSTIKAASNAVSALLTQSSVQDVTDADAAAEDEKTL